jgi:hypothetical protein
MGGKGRGREGGQRRGKGGEGREGRGGRGKGEVNPPPANPRSATGYLEYLTYYSILLNTAFRADVLFYIDICSF